MSNLKMPDINNLLIAGNLTCDPSFRKTTNGTPVANFFIASNRKFKDNNGQWRENVCYVGVVAWYKLAESCYENLKKGSAVIVDGELQSRSWRNDDGTSRNVVEIKARRIQFLNRKDFSKNGSELEEDFAEKEYDFEEIESEVDDDEMITDNQIEEQSEKEEVEDEISEYEFGYKDFNL
jgi:single-strand DNA-binding protein